MSSVVTLMETVTKNIARRIGESVAELAEEHNIVNPETFLDSLLTKLGLSEIKINASKKKDTTSETSSTSSARKRVVSKKMKDAFMTLEGATEDKLEEVIRLYKSASEEEVTDFLSMARKELKLPAEVTPVKEKKTKEKKEKSGRFEKWTPTATKLFKTIVEESGSTLTMDADLKKEFVTWLDTLTDEEFATNATQGHMRNFINTKN